MNEARHSPSPAKLNKARQRGDVARSAQLVAAAQISVVIAAAVWLVPLLGDSLNEWTRQWWMLAQSGGGVPLLVADRLRDALLGLVVPVGGTAVLFLGLSFLVALITSLAQTGWRLAPRPMSESPVLRPGSALRSMISRQKMAGVAGQLLAMVGVLIVGVLFCWQRMDWLLAVVSGDFSQTTRNLLRLTCLAGGFFAGLVCVSGLLDWFVQRQLWYRRQMMTDQEVREEARQDASPGARQGRFVSGGTAVDGIESVNTGP